jgi:CheY-like chemotaxis protein
MTVEWLDFDLLNEKCFDPIPYNYDEEGVFEKKETLHMLDMKNSEKSLDRYQVFKSVERGGIEFEHCNYAQKIPFGTLKVTIWDNSPGMTEDKLSCFFESDTADSSIPGLKKKSFKVSKEICKQMDGEIRAYSKEGVGTTFVACFPIPTYGFSHAYPDVRENILKIRKKKLKVMIGNIDPTFYFQIASDLRSLDSTVVAKASNVSEFFVSLVELSADSKRPVDLVIIDLSMPHLDAPVFCERLRNQERKNQLWPVYILLTGEIEKNDMITSLLNRNNPGYINKYLKRPFDFYSLLESLLDLSG